MTKFAPRSDILLALEELAKKGSQSAREKAASLLGKTPSIVRAMQYITESELWPKGKHTELTKTQLMHMAQSADEKHLDKAECARSIVDGIQIGRPHDKTIVASMQSFVQAEHGKKQVVKLKPRGHTM